MAIDLVLVWVGLISVAVLAYVVLDGFDLGIGILYPLLGGEQERDQAMNTVAPVWDRGLEYYHRTHQCPAP